MLIFSCELWSPIIKGCTTSTACNYNPEAKEDNNSCIDPLGCDNWCPGDTTDVKELDCADVCGGIQFIDCSGLCGILVEDECGVCGGNNAICTGCNGVVNGEAKLDNCGDCAGGDTGLEACTYDCTGYWGGDTELDQCGVCNGDNSTCTDCNEVVNGTAYIDGCSNCVGGNTGLIECTEDCEGLFGGTSVYDNCGICVPEEDTSCVQSCNGSWVNDGTHLVLDECNICGGNNSICADCLGVPNGVAYLDNCNTCDDDSTNDCMLGDANGDGLLNILDLVSLSNCILSNNCLDLGLGTSVDLSSDEVIDILDLSMIMSSLIGDNYSATFISINIDAHNIYMNETNGYVGGIQMTLSHSDNFSIQPTNQALLSDYKTIGDTTRFIVLIAEADDIATYSGQFEIVTILAASDSNYIPITINYIDCAGVWDGDAVLDECGVCDNDATNDCIQDCFGEWGGSATIDNCNTCIGGTTGIWGVMFDDGSCIYGTGYIEFSQFWDFGTWVHDYYKWYPGDAPVEFSGNQELWNSIREVFVNKTDTMSGCHESPYCYTDIWDHSHKVEFTYDGSIMSSSSEEFKQVFKDLCGNSNAWDTDCSNEVVSLYDNNNDTIIVIKDHHFYEGIQKYNMFTAGWVDNDSIYVITNDAGSKEAMTPHKLHYQGLYSNP